MSAAPPIREQLELLNRWLSEIWGRSLRLSDCISMGGISKDALPALRARLGAYLPRVHAGIVAMIQTEFEPRNASILIRRCGLDGTAPDELSVLGAAHGISRERIRQISLKLTQRMRGRRHRAALLTLLAREAALLLALPVPPPVDPATQVPVRRATASVALSSGGGVLRPTRGHLRGQWAATLVAAHGGPIAPGVTLPAVATPADDSCIQTFERFWQGLTPTAIARARDLNFSTIARHLAWLIEAGVIDWRALVPAEQRVQADAARRALGPDAPLSALRELLPGITYAMLGWIEAVRRREAALDQQESVGS